MHVTSAVPPNTKPSKPSKGLSWFGSYSLSSKMDLPFNETTDHTTNLQGVDTEWIEIFNKLLLVKFLTEKTKMDKKRNFTVFKFYSLLKLAFGQWAPWLNWVNAPYVELISCTKWLLSVSQLQNCKEVKKDTTSQALCLNSLSEKVKMPRRKPFVQCHKDTLSDKQHSYCLISLIHLFMNPMCPIIFAHLYLLSNTNWGMYMQCKRADEWIPTIRDLWSRLWEPT